MLTIRNPSAAVGMREVPCSSQAICHLRRALKLALSGAVVTVRTAQPGALLAEGSKRGDSLTVIPHHSGLGFELHLPTEVQTRMSLCQRILDSFISSSFTHD